MPTKPKSAFPNPAAVLPGEADVLANVLADLSDHDAKLVYSDWLEDRDDPRGPFLRKFVTAHRDRKALPALTGVPEAWRDLIGLALTVEIRNSPLVTREAKILAVSRPTINIDWEKAPEKALALGASKFGGRPDLPAGTKWPEFDGAPLSFLGQFNLAELAVSPVARDLPNRGLFSVFALYDEDEGNDDIDFDKGRWRFLYFPDDTNLVRHDFDDDLPSGSRFRSCRVSYSEGLTLPAEDSPWGKKLGVGPDSPGHETYFDLHMDMSLSDHLLGYPFTIQEDVLGKKSVRHLLTLDSNDGAGWEWGDGGQLYFTLTESDLKAQRFDRVKLELQCD
jgi:uncharacterized protein (TIGR02996 family)